MDLWFSANRSGTLELVGGHGRSTKLVWRQALWNVGVVGGDGRSSAPVKVIELSGESPDRGIRYRPVANGNCVFNRKCGEQPTANEQSVTLVNSIRPNLSGSLLETGELLISRIGPMMTARSVQLVWTVGGTACTVTEPGNVSN